jgi:hypothetical protein
MLLMHWTLIVLFQVLVLVVINVVVFMVFQLSGVAVIGIVSSVPLLTGPGYFCFTLQLLVRRTVWHLYPRAALFTLMQWVGLQVVVIRDLD